jgi:hypothetical protein
MNALHIVYLQQIILPLLPSKLLSALALLFSSSLPPIAGTGDAPTIEFVFLVCGEL